MQFTDSANSEGENKDDLSPCSAAVCGQLSLKCNVSNAYPASSIPNTPRHTAPL